MQPLSSGFHQISEEAMAHTCSMLECLSQLQKGPWFPLLSGVSCVCFVFHTVYFPLCTSWTVRLSWGRKTFTHCCPPDCWGREKQGWCPFTEALHPVMQSWEWSSGLRMQECPGQGAGLPRGTGAQSEGRWGSFVLSPCVGCGFSHSFFCPTDTWCEKGSYHVFPILCFPSPNSWVNNLHGHGMLPWAHFRCKLTAWTIYSLVLKLHSAEEAQPTASLCETSHGKLCPGFLSLEGILFWTIIGLRFWAQTQKEWYDTCRFVKKTLQDYSWLMWWNN